MRITADHPILRDFFAPAPPPVRRGLAFKRAALWFLHFSVITLAVLSACTNRFDLWLDLRALGPAALLLQFLWALTVLPIPFLAGPRLAGFLRNPRWVHSGLAPRWALRLLAVTGVLIVCLLINTIYFFLLCAQGKADLAVPLPLLVAALLTAWLWLTWSWMIASRRLPPTAPTARLSHILAFLAAVPTAVVLAAAFLVHMYAQPPQDPVDLAVVLGGHVMQDNVASVELADRVRAAITLYKNHQAKHILLSGAIYPKADPNAPETNEITAMKQVCIDNGVPEDAISLDPVGVNTRATAYNSARFMRNEGFNSVVACSTDFHLYRTALSFREAGVRAYTLPSQPADWRCADPRDTLREIVAIAVYTINPTYRQPKAVVMNLSAPRIVVRKSARSLKLFDGPTFVKSYPCITGGNDGDKEVEGDRKTPIGKFRIVYKNPESQYHLSLGLDYPNQEDADRGLKAGLISQAQYDGILEALTADLSKPDNQKKLWKTPLGGEIFLHGHANDRAGTAGCVALSNRDIEELYAVLPLGTPVEIEP